MSVCRVSPARLRLRLAANTYFAAVTRALSGSLGLSRSLGMLSAAILPCYFTLYRVCVHNSVGSGSAFYFIIIIFFLFFSALACAVYLYICIYKTDRVSTDFEY